MQKNSLISIVIPVYNRQELVKETLNSVLGQTYPNWECIVVDDGSTDNTWESLEEYAAKDERIKIYKRHREPKGAPTCRNIGIELSKGEYLMFLDSDDLVTPNCLAYRIEKIKENPNNSAWMFGTGVFHKTLGDTNILWNKLNTKEDDVVRFLNQDMPWHTSGPVWLNKNLLQFNEEALSFQDWEYHIRFLMRKKKYYKDLEDKPMVFYKKDYKELHDSISLNGTLKTEYIFNKTSLMINVCNAIQKETAKYNLDILKLIFRNIDYIKQLGLKKEAFFYWKEARERLVLPKTDSAVLNLFLLFNNKKNKRYLEFVIYRVLKKGYLFERKKTFMT